MREKERSVSGGTVIGFGFIILGILNFIASQHYHKTSISSTSRLPGILFILIGLIIIILITIKKSGK
jgi:hypothetical protein